jgi:hypothetical protein
VSTTLDHNRGAVREEVTHNNLHQVTGYKESWVDNRTPEVSERVEITGATYNNAGRLAYGHEVKTQTGLLESRVETDRWVNYDEQGRVKVEKTISKSDNGIVEEKERRVTGYTVFGSEAGDVTRSEERGHDSWGIEVYRIQKEIARADVYYDDHGRSLGYTETIVASDKPDMETKHVWTASGYNANDQLLGFKETWVALSDAGQHETRTTRSGMEYDLTGRMTAYRDRTTSNADDTVETLAWKAAGYNGAGLITGSKEEKLKTCETTGSLYNVLTRTNRTNMLYDRAGNLLHYTQSENGTDRPDLRTETEWDAAYDALGRMTRYLEKVRSTDIGTGGRVLSTYEENDRMSMAYDGSNHLVGYTEKTLDKLGNRNERAWTATYGARGLMTGYVEIKSDDRGNHTFHNQEDIKYDFAGRVIAVVDIEHDPLNTVTISERSGIHYNRAGLAYGMDEKGTQTDGGGVRTEWSMTQGPILYDLVGRVFLRQEERVKRIRDVDGALARESIESETFANAFYNRLGQVISHETLIDRRSPDGRLTESERSVVDETTYNRLGQTASYHKEENEEGRSVETLVLPANWEELGLHPEERLLWLENLTFLVGGEAMALDELGQRVTNGMAVSWADLTSAQKVQLLSSGQTTLNGEIFRLAGAAIVWQKSTIHSFDQSHMTYSRYGALQHYKRSGDENGVGYVQDWTSTGFDVHDRVLGFHEDMKKETQARVVTDRTGTVYNARSLAVAYTETVRDGASPDVVTVTETKTGHDALKRTVWSLQTNKKNGNGPDGVVDTTTTIWLGNYLYDGFDRAAAYDEVRFDGTTLKIGGAERTWDSLSAGERASILEGSLTPMGQTVEVSRVAGVAYSATDRQSGFARVTRRWGESEMAPGVSGTTALMEETHLVRAGTSFNTNQQALGYKEAASSTSEPEVVRLSEVTSLVYNAAGQTAGFDALTRKMGFDLDVLETLERSGVVYNRFGQMAGYFDRTVLNGLNVERFVTGLTYDDQERLTGSRTLTRQFGMESRAYYLQGGRTLTSAEVAALLMAHPGKTLEELLASGVLTQETRMEALDETTLSVTSGLVYDDLNRVIRSVETTFGADGSITTSTLSDIGYDQWGRPAGMTMTIHLGGVVPVTEYVLDGSTLTPEALDALLAQQEQSSGRTAAQLMTGWLTSGRLTTRAVSKAQDVTITTLRENMRYNQNGQVVGYRETNRDPANNIARQVSTVAIEYNRAGQSSRQISDVRLDNVDGSWTESQTVLTYRYDAAGRLQGGTSATASRTVTAVWTDTDQDGQVDRLTTLPESRASSVQEYGVFNGQAQALWQSSRQESANVGGGTSASVSSMVFQYGPHGRLMGALGVMDTRSDDGFGNRTGGAVVQLFGAPGSSLKLLSSVTETVTLGADGGSNHTVLSTVFNYDGSGNLGNARSVGHFNGTEVGLTILDGVREEVETSFVRGRITQEYQIVMNEARVSVSTTQTHSEIPQGSVLDQTTVTTYLYDAAGRLTGASAVVSGTGTNYGWTDRDEDGDMDAWETAGTMEISGTQTYVVMNGTALVKENRTRQILRAETGSVSTSDMTVRYGYDAVGNLAWAQGTGTVDSVERAWSDTNNDGTVDTLEVAGRTLSEIRQTYAIINNQARVTRSDTTTRGVDPVTGRVLSEGEHGYSRVLTRVEFVYDAVGRLTAADGRSEGRSNVEVWSDADMDGVIDAGEMMDQVTEVATENDYVVIQGSAQVVRSVTQSSMTVGASRSTSVNAMAFEYDRLGRLVGAVGDSFGTTTTKFWNDADADGVVDNGEMLDQVTHAETSNVFRIIRGQAVLLESRSNSSITTALGESRTASWTRNRYDAAGRLVSATGGATGTSTTQFWNDNDMDGAVDADEMVVQTTTFETFNSYQILLGQAMLSVSRSESATRTPLTQTTTTSVTSYQYNARGQLIGAGGTATGSTTTVVWNDADQDGVMEPGERVPQTTTFSTTNTYRIMAGQAMVSEARTSSLSANGNVRTETLNITRYRYSADGVLIGATGTTTGTTITTVWNDADLDGVMDAGERVGQTTTFTTQSEYRILQGQAMVVRSDTHSVAVAGAATTVTDTRMNYQYNALGVLIGATGSTQGTTTTLVKNEPDGGSGGLVSQTSTFTTSNVYRISQGQAVVLRSITHTVAVAGTTTTTTDSWTTNTYDRDGLLTGTTGGSSGASATTVWNDVDMDGVQDGGEMVVQTGTFSSQNTYRVLQGQSVVTASTTHTESVAGTTSTVTDSWMTYRYDNQGMLIGADGASSGSSKTEVWNDADQDRQIDAGEIVLQTQTFSARNTYRVVQGQAVVYESFTHTESVFDNTTTVTDGWVRYQYNAQGILWGATGGATSRATKPVWNDANQNGTIDPGERVTETTTTTTTNTYRIVQGQAVVWEARSHTVTGSGLTTTVSDNWVRYQYNAQGLLVGASGGGSGTTSTTVWNDRDRDGVMDAGELTSNTSTFTSASTYRILQGQAVVSRSTTHTVEVVGGTTTEVDNWMEFRYDARGMLIGATGGASGRRYWSSSYTSSWSESGSTTSGDIVRSFTSVTTSTTNSYYEMRWTANSTYIIFNGTAKPTKTDTRSSYSSQTTTTVVTNKTESWIEKRMEPVTRTKTVTTTGKDGKTTTTTVTETVMVEKTYHMTGTTKTTAWSSVYYSGGGTSSQTFLYDAQGQLVGERRHEESWDNPAIVEGGMNTSTTVTSLERGKDGRPITNYTITDGALQSGGTVWGVGLSVGMTASINQLAASAGGWISQLAVNSRGEVEVTLSVFDKVLTPGKGLSWQINPGQQFLTPQALGSITIGLSADDYVNRVEGALTGVRTLAGLMRAKDAEGFRNQASLLVNQEGGWLESTQMTVFSDKKAFSLTVDRGATGAAQSTLANAFGHLVLGNETSVARGLALLKAAPVNNPDNLAAWGKDLMEDGAILGFRFNLPGFDKKTGSGFVLGGSLDGNGSPHITVLQMVDGDEIKGLGVPLSKIGEPKGAPVTTVLVLLKDMESADEAGLGELVGKGIEDGNTTGLVTIIASENVNLSPIDNGFGVLDEVATSSITTQPKTTVTDSWVDYRYNEEGLLVGATGGATGTSTQQVWNDANQDGVVDPGELVSQTSSFTTTNTYRIFHGQAVVVESSTHAVTSGGTGTTVTDSWVKYQYNKDGLLVGATGGTVGSASTTVWNDANQDGVLGAGEMVQQTSTFSTTNTYRIIYGQAMVFESFTHSESAGGSSVNVTDSWTRYEYDANGILVGATGGASGTTSGMVWNDENQDGVMESGEMVYQTTSFSSTNRYRIIQGQAVVVKSNTHAVGTAGAASTVTDSWISYQYDANGLLVGAKGASSGITVSTVWSDGALATQTTTFETQNVYRIIQGQAAVVETSTHAVSKGALTTTVTDSWVRYQYSAQGILIGATGGSIGTTTTVVWSDADQDDKIDDGELIDQVTSFESTNVYRILQGQALVSHTQTQSLAKAGLTTTHSQSWVDYRYDANGMLIGATGGGAGTTQTTVWNDADKDKTLDEGELVEQTTRFTTVNSYRILQGQALVSDSRTHSETRLGATNTVTDSWTQYYYDGLGRLTGAVGGSQGTTTTEVLNDTNQNQRRDPGETAVQETRFTTENTYRVIQGQAMVSESRTHAETTAGSSVTVTDSWVRFVYDLNGMLVGASGGAASTTRTFVWNDANQNNVMESDERVEHVTVSESNNTYRVLHGQAVVVATHARVETTAGLSRTESESWTNYAYQADGLLVGATGSAKGTTTTIVWNDANGNGAIEADERVPQVTDFNTTNEYRVLQGQAVLFASQTHSVTVAGLVRTETTSQVLFQYDARGMLVGATGSSSGTTRTTVLSDGELVEQTTTFNTTNTYAIVQGQAVIVASRTHSEGTAGLTRTVTDSWAQFQYNAEGMLVAASGGSNGVSKTTIWSDLDGNGQVGATEYTTQDTYFQTTNTYRIIQGQAVVTASSTTSSMVNGATTTVTNSSTNYQYNAEGMLVGATGGSTGQTTVKQWNDADKDGVVDPGEMVDQITTFSTTNEYQIRQGQAVVSSSRTHSETHSPANTTVSDSWTLFQYDARGLLVGATGGSLSTSTTHVFNDADKDGVVDPGEMADQIAVSESANQYRILQGQAVVVESTSRTTTTLGATTTTTTNVVRYDYRSDGLLIGATGESDGTTRSLVFNDEDHDGVLDDGELEEQTTVFHTDTTYRIVLGQAMAVETRTHSETAVGSTTTVSDSWTRYSYDAEGKLNGAEGGTNGVTTSEVWNDVNQNQIIDSGELVDQTTTFSTTNTYRILRGQAVVVESNTHSVSTAGASVRTNNSQVEYQYNADGILVGATGSSTGTDTSSVWSDTDQDGVVDDGEIINLVTTSSTTSTYRVLFGQAVVIQNQTRSTVRSGASDTVSYSVTNYQYNQQGILVGATGTTAGSTTTTVWDDKDRDGSMDAARTEQTAITSFSDTWRQRNSRMAIGAPALWNRLRAMSPEAARAFLASMSPSQRSRLGVRTETTGFTETVVEETRDEENTFTTVYTYIILHGQAVVLKAETTSYAVGANGQPITDPLADGYSKTVSVTNYRYDVSGRLIGADGTTESWGTTHVKTWVVGSDGKIVGDTNKNGTLDSGETWQYHFVPKQNYSMTVNTFAILQGQAVVIQSVTDSYQGTQGGVLGEDGSHTRTTVNYHYNDLGQLMGAEGFGTTESWETVFHDPEGDGAGQYRVVYNNGTTFTQKYNVILGRAMVVSQTTTTDFTGRDGTNEHSVMTLTYTYNGEGQLIRATGHGETITNDPGAEDGSQAAKQTKTVVDQVYGMVGGEMVLLRATSQSYKSVTPNTSAGPYTRYSFPDSAPDIPGHQISEFDLERMEMLNTSYLFNSTLKSELPTTSKYLFPQPIPAPSSWEAEGSATTVVYYYDEQGHLVDARGYSGNGPATTSSDILNPFGGLGSLNAYVGVDNAGVSNAYDSFYPGTNTQTQNTQTQYYAIYDGKALLMRQVDIQSDGSIVTAYKYDANGRLTGAKTTGYGGGGGSSSSTTTSTETTTDANGVTTTTTTTSTTTSSWSYSWAVSSTYGVFDGRAKVLTSSSSSSSESSSSTTTDSTSNSTWTEKQKDGSTLDMNSTTQTTTVADSYSSGGSSSYTVNQYSGVGRLLHTETNKSEWSQTSMTVSVNTTTHVWSDQSDAQGHLTDFTINNGALQPGARVQGTFLSAAAVSNVNALAGAAGGWVSGLSINDLGKLVVNIQMFDRDVLPGAPLTWTGSWSGDEDPPEVGLPKAIGSVSVALDMTPVTSGGGMDVQVTSEMVAGIRELTDLARAGDAEGFRNLAVSLRTGSDIWLESASMFIEVGNDRFVLTVAGDGKGGTATYLSYSYFVPGPPKLDSEGQPTGENEQGETIPVGTITLASTTTVADGMALIKNAPREDPDALGVWAATQVGNGTLLGGRFYLTGFDFKTYDGQVLEFGVDSLGNATFQILVLDAGKTLYGVSLSTESVEAGTGVSPAMELVNGLNTADPSIFATQLAAGVNQGIITGLTSLDLSTDLGQGVLNLLFTAEGRSTLATIMGVDELSLPEGITDAAMLGEYLKNHGLEGFAVWVDENRDGAKQENEQKNLAILSPELAAILTAAVVDMQDGTLSIGRDGSGEAALTLQVTLRDSESGARLGWLTMSWNPKEKGMDVGLNLNLRNPEVARGVARLMAGLMGLRNVDNLSDLEGALLGDPSLLADLKEMKVEVGGRTINLYDMLGGERFEDALRNGFVDWAGSTFSFGVRANGESYFGAQLLVRDSKGSEIGSISLSWTTGDSRIARLFSPNLGNAVVRGWFVAALGDLLGMGRDLTEEQLQTALKDSTVLNAIINASATLADGTTTTLGALFGDAFFAALSRGQIDWRASQIVFGVDGKGALVFNASLSLRDDDGVMGWLVFSFNKETGRIDVGMDINLGHENMLELCVAGLGAILGLSGIDSRAELEAALKDPAVQEVLKETKITVGGEETTLNDLFGSEFFDALREGTVNWKDSRVSLALDDRGRGQLSASLAVFGKNGLLGRYVIEQDTKSGRFGLTVSANLVNRTVLGMLVGGLAKLFGLAGVDTVARLEAGLKSDDVLARLEGLTIIVNGEKTTLAALFGEAFFTALREGRIAWGESSLRFGRTGDGEMLLSVSLGVRGADGLLGAFTVGLGEDEIATAGLAANLGNRRVLEMLSGGIGKILGLGNNATVDDLERALSSDAFVNELKESIADGVSDPAVLSLMEAVLNAVVTGGRVDWASSTLSFGQTSDRKATVSLSLVMINGQGRAAARIVCAFDADKGGFSLSVVVRLSEVADLLRTAMLDPGKAKALETLARTFGDGPATQALLAYLAGGSLRETDGWVTVGLGADGKAVLALEADFVDVEGQYVGQFRMAWDSDRGTFSALWTGLRLDNPLVRAMVEETLGRPLEDVTPEWVAQQLTLKGDAGKALKPLLEAFAKTLSADFSNGELSLGVDGKGAAVFALTADLLKDGKIVGQVSIGWDPGKEGFTHLVSFNGKLAADFSAIVTAALEAMEIVGQGEGHALTVNDVFAAAGATVDYSEGALVFGVAADGGSILGISFEVRDSKGEGIGTLGVNYEDGKGFASFLTFEFGAMDSAAVARVRALLESAGVGAGGDNPFADGLPLGEVDWSTGSLTLGTTAQGNGYLKEMGTVRDDQGRAIGDYVLSVTAGDSGVSIDRFVSYDVNAASVREAIRSGVLPDIQAHTPEVGRIDPLSGRLIVGMVGGEAVERLVYDIVDERTGSVIGQRIDGTRVIGEEVVADHYSDFDLSAPAVQRAIQSGALTPPDDQAGLDGHEATPPPPPAAPDRNAFYDIEGYNRDNQAYQYSFYSESGSGAEQPDKEDYFNQEAYDAAVDKYEAELAAWKAETGLSSGDEWESKYGERYRLQQSGGVPPFDVGSSIGEERATEGRFIVGTMAGDAAHYVQRDIHDPAGNVIGSHTFGTVGGKATNSRAYDLSSTYVQNAIVSGALPFPPAAPPEMGIDTSARPVGDNVRGTYTIGLVDGSCQLTVSWDRLDSEGRVTEQHERGWRPGYGAFAVDRRVTAHDAQGRARADEEQRWDEGNGTTTTVRRDIAYDANGRVYSYNGTLSKNGGTPAEVTVHSILYDKRGREIERTMTVKWGPSHYGLVPGVSDGPKGWQNGEARVTITKTYDRQNRLVEQTAQGHVTHADNSELAGKNGYSTSFDFRMRQYGMEYDQFGRLIHYKSETWAPAEYSTGGKKSKQVVGNVTTTSEVRLTNLDQYGRAGEINTSWSNDKRSNGWTRTSEIVYDSFGNVLNQKERYHTESKSGKNKTKVDGERIVTNTYNDRHELVSVDENKLWEHQKTSGGGFFSSILGKIIMAIITVVIAVFAPEFLPALYSTLGTALATAVVVFATTFVITFVATGDFKLALLSAVIAAVASYMQVQGFDWFGGAGGQGVYAQVANQITRDVAGNIVYTASMDTLKNVLVREIVGTLVVGLLQHFAPQLGFLGSMVTNMILGAMGVGGENAVNPLEALLKGDLNKSGLGMLVFGELVTRALGEKGAWLGALVTSLFSFDKSGLFPNVSVSWQKILSGLVKSIMAKIVERVQIAYGYLANGGHDGVGGFDPDDQEHLRHRGLHRFVHRKHEVGLVDGRPPETIGKRQTHLAGRRGRERGRAAL